MDPPKKLRTKTGKTIKKAINELNNKYFMKFELSLSFVFESAIILI